MSHAASRRRRLARDEPHYRLLHMGLDVSRGGLLRITADFADHHDGMRVRIGVEKLQRVHEIRADNRIAANPDASRLTDSQARQLPHRFVSQGAGSRHHADVSFFMDVSRHDPDFTLARRNDTRAVGSDEPRLPALQKLPGFDHVKRRNPFRDANHQRQTGVGGFHNGVSRKGRRHENHRHIRPGVFQRLRHGIKHGQVQMFSPALSRRYPAHHVGSVSDRLLRVKRAFPAGESLNDQSRIFVYQYAHPLPLPDASFTTFSAASRMSRPTAKSNPDSSRIFRPSSTLVPSMRTTIGTWILRSRAAATTPLASVSQRRIPPKMLISTALTFLSESRIWKAFLTCSALAPPPTSRKFAGLPPAYLMMSMVAMARPAPFTIQPTVPSSLM